MARAIAVTSRVEGPPARLAPSARGEAAAPRARTAPDAGAPRSVVAGVTGSPGVADATACRPSCGRLPGEERGALFGGDLIPWPKRGEAAVPIPAALPAPWLRPMIGLPPEAARAWSRGSAYSLPAGLPGSTTTPEAAARAAGVTGAKVVAPMSTPKTRHRLRLCLPIGLAPPLRKSFAGQPSDRLDHSAPLGSRDAAPAARAYCQTGHALPTPQTAGRIAF